MSQDNVVRDNLTASIDLKQRLLADTAFLETVQRTAEQFIECFRHDGKVYFCGNGGSAADCQHLAAELSGRYYYDRQPLFCEALHCNTSYLTAVGNDYGYAETYARLVRAVGRPGDVLVALSTSGNSPNVLRACRRAREVGMTVVGWTGESGGALRELCDLWLGIPSADTPRIQECHMLAGHAICQIVEATLFPTLTIDPSWTLFLDRDGVINRLRPGEYVRTLAEFELLPGAVEAIVALGRQFSRIVIVTNQQGVGKKLMSATDLDQIHEKLLAEVRAAGGRIDAIYYAPNLDEEGSPDRKPGPGMALRARADFPEIDFNKSLMVGDKESDMVFGRTLGMRVAHVFSTPREQCPEADLYLDRLAELPGRLRMAN